MRITLRHPNTILLRKLITITLSTFILILIITDCAKPASYAEKKRRRKRALKAAEVKHYPKIKWKDAYELMSPKGFYIVKTNTSYEVASYIGQLMDFAQINYRKLFGYNDKIPAMQINAYRTTEEYLSVIMTMAPHLSNSNGIFLVYGGVSSIHLPYVATPTDKTSPTKTLMHEGTHQFVNIVFDFHIPDNLKKYFAGNQNRLSSVPQWMHEGLATYMETSYYDGNSLVVGEINTGRLKQLQHEMRTGRHVTIRKLLNSTEREFDTSHYATAWGLVYWLMNDDDTEKLKIKKNILKTFLMDCRKGFMENPEKDFKKRFIDKKSYANFGTEWNKHTRRGALNSFLRLTIGTGAPLERWEKWEEKWKQWILSLSAN